MIFWYFTDRTKKLLEIFRTKTKIPPKIMVFIQKKRSSLEISLIFFNFCPKIKVFSKKKGLHLNLIAIIAALKFLILPKFFISLPKKFWFCPNIFCQCPKIFNFAQILETWRAISLLTPGRYEYAYVSPSCYYFNQCCNIKIIRNFIFSIQIAQSMRYIVSKNFNICFSNFKICLILRFAVLD